MTNRLRNRLAFCSTLAFGLTTLLVAAGGCPLFGHDESQDDPNEVADANMIIIGNRAPVARAGDDQAVTAGAQVFLSGAGSSDDDRDRLTFAWQQVGGSPAVSLEDAFSSSPRFFSPNVTTATTLTFLLQVTDGLIIALDDVAITVQP